MSIVSIHIPPSVHPFFWLAALAVFPLLIINFCFFTFWIFARFKNAFFSFVILFLGLTHFKSTFSYANKEPTDNLKVVSYNVRLFNLYSKEKSETKTKAAFVSWVNEENPDVICLQEFQDNQQKIITQLKKAGYVYHHSYLAQKGSPELLSGNIIFSKYPLLSKGLVEGGYSLNQTIYADIHYKEDTVRVYNAHLKSMSLNKKLKDQLKVEKSRLVLWRKLAKGAVGRAEQVEEIVEHLNPNDRAIIFCGDLNDTPYSYVYHSLKSLMQNAFESSGKGFGFTLNHHQNDTDIRFLRIDHQFYNSKLSCDYFKTDCDMYYTDHYPIIANYTLLK